MVFRPDQGSLHILRDGFEYRLRFVVLLAHYCGDVGFENPRLFARNGSPGRAEKRLMVQIDGGDTGDDGMDHIGAVQPAAHAHFNHGHVDFGFGKGVKGKAYAHFEKAQLQGTKPSASRFPQSPPPFRERVLPLGSEFVP